MERRCRCLDRGVECIMTGEGGLEEREEEDGCEDISTQDSNDCMLARIKAMNPLGSERHQRQATYLHCAVVAVHLLIVPCLPEFGFRAEEY